MNTRGPTVRTALLAILALLAVAAALAYAWRGAIATALMQRTVTARMTADPVAALPDGLHVGLCGAGSPFPDERRSGPCTVVFAGRRMFVFDAGSGASRGLSRMGFDAGRIEAVFLTHFHSDHIDGLGELLLQRWVAGAHETPVPVFGPTGVERVVGGVGMAYALDRGYRVAHHGESVVPPAGFGGTARAFDAHGPTGRAVVLQDGDLEIVAFTVDHAPVDPAVGYRIRYKGRTAVISGDTKKSAAVEREARDADLLLHEALSPRLLGLLESGATAAGRTNLQRIFKDVLDYHTTPEQAAETARDARVRVLVLHHIVPPLPLQALDGPFLGDAPKIFPGELRVGADGDFVSLPAGGDAVRIARR